MKVAPYGEWKSPITPDLITKSSIRISELVFEDGKLYWLESRPGEAGRNVIVQLQPDGTCKDIIASPYDAKTKVHEYGGGSFIVKDEVVYFTNFTDQRLYSQPVGNGIEANPVAVTQPSQRRFADMCFDEKRSRIIAVCENHEGEIVTNTICSINLRNGEVIDLLSGCNPVWNMLLFNLTIANVIGYDFQDGQQLCWISWMHPCMPWDGTRLHVAQVNAGDDGNVGYLGEQIHIAGSCSESVCSPQWSPGNILYFISDRSGWYNIHRYRKPVNSNDFVVERVCSKEAEFAEPQWRFGLQPFHFIDEETIICKFIEDANFYLGILTIEGCSNGENSTLCRLDLPYSYINALCPGVSNFAYLLASGVAEPLAVVKVALELESASIADTKKIRSEVGVDLDLGYVSTPCLIEYPTKDGEFAFGWYYPPQNKDFKSRDGELPPLLVQSHGGPTSMAVAGFDLKKKQFWTSRGFAVVDVNYRGSSGFGREYRDRLKGNWGIVDVDDCVSAAEWLCEQGKVDRSRIAITGGSAGGYTTLAALTRENCMFKAGASHYGIGDLRVLARDTHKFESRYLDSLVGTFPEDEIIYNERSPINKASNLKSPIIFFQGLDDKVVTPNQAQMMVEVLKSKGIPVAHVEYEGEGHGFRKAANIKHSLEGEYYFYSQVFGYTVPDDLTVNLEIFNNASPC